jgi:hypothetical protein
VERAMKIQEVLLRAMSGALTWLQAAGILGMHPRSLRRGRARQQRVGLTGCSIVAASAPRLGWRRLPRSWS